MKLAIAFFFGFGMALLIGCGNGPKLTIYLSDPSRLGMEFFNENTGKAGFVPYSATDKYVCLDPADMNALISYCGIKK